MGVTYRSYSEWLRVELLARCQKNPRYSLRAFAKHLDVSPSFLSRVMAGKRQLTQKTGEQIARRIAKSPGELEDFLKILGKSKTLSAETHEQVSARVLSEDVFHVISDWYHYAITELVFLPGFKNNPKWISEKLGITPVQARKAVDRLTRLGILRNQKGKTVKVVKDLKTTSEIASFAIRRFNKQVLELAANALDNISLDKRDITTMTFSMDMAQMPLAKEKIRAFRRSLTRQLERGTPTDVCILQVQLYPLTVSEKDDAKT
jgi:uncharacterized protein (TIGR02147 family)